MSEERAVYRINTDRAPLAGPFELVFQRVLSDPTRQPARVLALFAYSLAEGEAFNLSRLEKIPEADQTLSLALFDFCLNVGVTEEDRRAVVEAFSPFVEIYTPGTRH